MFKTFNIFSMGNVGPFSLCAIKNKTFVYMFPIADQTAGPIGLNFFVNTHGWPGGVIG